MRKAATLCIYILALFIVTSCNQKETSSSIQIKKLDYPSASAVEYYNDRLYVMGDDATNMIVLDTNLNIIDSISIISYPAKRIPKEIKPDFEASVLYNDHLFLFGSGSLTPYRNSGKRIDIHTMKNDTITVETLYSTAKQLGIGQINIEGACYIKNTFLLASRGNKSYRKNFLINVSKDFGIEDSISFYMSIIQLEQQNDTAFFQGVSGLCYAPQHDKLIMTVSTEDTRNAYEDGAIGKSYLWIVDSVSKKLAGKTIKVDRVLDLEETDPRFKNQKIESAILTAETNKTIRLVLVADNDDGSSTIFKMSINKSNSHGE